MKRSGLFFFAALPALSGVLYLASATATEAFTINGCFGGGAGPALNDYANMPLYCGTTSVQGGVTGGSPVIPSGGPQQFAGSSPGAAALAGAGPDLGGSASSAASPGAVHAFADAHSFRPDPGGPAADISSAGQTAFWDAGKVRSLTLPIGAAVSVEVVIDAAGSFAGGASALILYNLRDYASGVVIDGPGDTLGETRPPLHRVNDFTAHVGDIISFDLYLEATARAARNEFPLKPDQTADVSNTGHLYLDVLTPGAGFDSLSDHNYSLNALAVPVPEPTSLVLLGFGMAALGIARRKWISR
jgi:hypothetical protein